MSFLDKLSKGVGRAADQAKFEADKLMRVKRLDSEIGKLSSEKEKAVLAVGARAIELRIAELEELIKPVETLEAQLAGKKAELEAVKAEQFEETEPSAPSTPSTPTTPSEKYCPSCGAAVQAGTKFCPSCGQKLS
jgi:rubrerythrin